MEDEVIIKIKGEIEGLRKSLDETKSLVQSSSNEIKNSLASGFNIKDMITGLIGFDILKSSFSMIKNFIASSFEEFKNAELYAKRLEYALRLSGGGGIQAANDLRKYADELQKVTRFSNDAIVQTMAYMASFGIPESVIRKAIPLILDMAEAFDLDLRSATLAVAKAFEGNFATLQRYGIYIDKAKFETQGFTAVLDELRSKIGGIAQEVGTETLAGKIDRLKNSWSDFKKNFAGTILAPVATPALDFLNTMLTGPKPESAVAWSDLTSDINIFNDEVLDMNKIVQNATYALNNFMDVGSKIDFSHLINQVEAVNISIEKQTTRWSAMEQYIKSHPEMFGYTEKASKPYSFEVKLEPLKEIEEYYKRAMLSDKDYDLWKEAQRRDELLKVARNAEEQKKIWDAYYANVKKIQEKYTKETEEVVKSSIKRTWSTAELIGPSNLGLEELRGAWTYNMVKRIEVVVKGSNTKVNANDADAATKIGRAILTLAGRS